ncbi:hypothetical protein, partial [Candidatus Synechococcus spongiarum]
EPEAQPSGGGGADVAGPEPEQGESTLNGLDKVKASQVDAPFQDADDSATLDVALEDDPENVAAAGEGGEGLVIAAADAVGGAPQAMTDVSGVETEPAQSAGEDSPQPAQEGEDLVVSSFDEVDEKLREAN